MILRALPIAIFTCCCGWAQTPNSTVEELLKEVRALRLAIERTNQIGPQVQIALARMQAQEERVRAANNRFQDARERLSSVQSRRADLGDNLKRLEAMQNETTDPGTRKEYEAKMTQSKIEMDMLGTQEQRLRGMESDAQIAASSEQARWNQADDQLRSLEKLLAPQH